MERSLKKAGAMTVALGLLVVPVLWGFENPVHDSNEVTLSGTHRVPSFEVPEGVTIEVEEDLLIISEGSISIDGLLIVRNRNPEDRLDGARIELYAATEIEVGPEGAIRGGAGGGALYQSERGNSGSSIILSAPTVWIDGVVQAGAGGRGQTGGDGGTVRIRGNYITHRKGNPYSSNGQRMWGAIGGDGGLWGGNGGDVITEVCSQPRAVSSACDGRGSVAASQTALHLWDDPPPGTDGAAGGGSQGGVGATGAPGANGSSISPSGQPGGVGGVGGSVTGGNGQGGGQGGGGCPGAGGTGGAGGAGGTGTGGIGGAGGQGGNAYEDPSTHEPQGPGGNGGAGGSGGTGTGGNGGNGGAGGPNAGNGGAGGAAGNGVAGPGGQGGAGGSGTTPGTPGQAGGSGGAASGSAGAHGAVGPGCPGPR